MTEDGPDPEGPAEHDPATQGPATHGPAAQGPAAQGPAAQEPTRPRPAVRLFHRPLVLGIVALVLAVSGASTIAYAVTRPDANHPPSVIGAQDASGGVPAPVLPAAPPSTPVPSARPTVPPPLPAASVVPFFPTDSATGTPSPSTSSRPTSSRHRRSPAPPSASPSRTRTPTPTATASPIRTTSPSRAPGPAPSGAPTTLPTPLGSSDPVEVVIRKLGIDRKPIRLGLTRDNALEVPTDAEDLGWYTGGPTPGAMGPAVIAGHVSYNKPGVFFRLATLHRGDVIEVKRRDGKTAVYTVSGTRVYPKDKFPTDDVYGFVDRAALRLITCGGDYDAKTRHFDDNVVVYADMTSTKG